MNTKTVIVSPDVVSAAHGDAVSVRVDDPREHSAVQERVILIPMAEWKQCLVRATRATIPAFLVVGAGGTAAQAATGAGIPPLMMVGLPTTGIFIVDTIIVCLVIWILWFLWNVVEFWLDLDENQPQLRA